ncbi:hypothetical protein INT45_013095 [Circinella minor]|uniref:Uncharacterized protein n=1 Tax=Circinella minor TaxID=1195481 RepID=A0A8H7RQ03_9FUNG|nr:hypothetical protein INT45_013095 [Circinella minor]
MINPSLEPTSQAPHQHPRASFAQLMSQPMYQPFGSTLLPSSETVIIGRLDSIQGEMTSINQAISRLQETVNLLVERQGQQGVTSGGQDRADSDDEADKLPLDFVCQPCNSRGKVRNLTKSDIEGAILALVNGNVEEQQKKLAGIEKHVDTAIRRLKMLVPSNIMVSDSRTSQDKSINNAIMKLFLDPVSKSHPFVPLDKCEKNWFARHFLVQK